MREDRAEVCLPLITKLPIATLSPPRMASRNRA